MEIVTVRQLRIQFYFIDEYFLYHIIFLSTSFTTTDIQSIYIFFSYILIQQQEQQKNQQNALYIYSPHNFVIVSQNCSINKYKESKIWRFYFIC